MDKQAEITHREWSDVTARLEKVEEQQARNNDRLNRHSGRIDELEASRLILPLEIQNAITESLKPVMESIVDVSTENKKLSNEIAELKLEKYKANYSATTKIVWGFVMAIVAYFASLLLNNIFS